MLVCVEPARGYYFRINSEDKWQRGILISVALNPTFLDHDSYLECGTPCEFDDYIVEQSIRQNGILGTLNAVHVLDICRAMRGYGRMSGNIRAEISVALNCP